MAETAQNDPQGLIRESYRIEGITIEQCRSIFFDWAMSLPEGAEARRVIPGLLEQYGDEGHPMTAVLRDGLEAPPEPKRRGGRSARVE
ncbi:hypothetical protein [Pseudoroseicyclus tamaricis]|uniref:Uncharacterized protein n=1 Tax=Pseudoroseicyclus tamaricis TaxID=2705421 RepID=A0A6B2JZS4_9RHOB|nr:hypothetical protein [Pseudoroseicyclus tamaricis]NDV00872.1 hypothetical protein [Pseudoroseicyclus tamaricis]